MCGTVKSKKNENHFDDLIHLPFISELPFFGSKEKKEKRDSRRRGLALILEDPIAWTLSLLFPHFIDTPQQITSCRQHKEKFIRLLQLSITTAGTCHQKNEQDQCWKRQGNPLTRFFSHSTSFIAVIRLIGRAFPLWSSSGINLTLAALTLSNFSRILTRKKSWLSSPNTQQWIVLWQASVKKLELRKHTLRLHLQLFLF